MVQSDRMNSGDVFILVCGEDKVRIWIGSDTNADERANGSEVVMDFCKGGGVTVLDQVSNDGEVEAADFWGYLLGKVTAMGMFKKTLNVQEIDGLDSKVKVLIPVLLRISDDMHGEIKKLATAKPVAVGPTKSEFTRIRRTDFQHKNGYLFDTGFHVYIWLGIDAARKTGIMAITQSNACFRKYIRPLLPVTILKAGQETVSSNTHFSKQEEELDELKARMDEQIKRNWAAFGTN